MNNKETKKEQNNKKNMLVIAYFFPPTGGVASAAAQRTLKFVRYLPDFGWNPIVLTAKEKSYERYIQMDHSLLDKVPDNIEIKRSSVLRGVNTLLRLRRKFIDSFKKTVILKEKRGDLNVNAINTRSQNVISGFQQFKNSITDLFQIPDEQAGWFLPAFKLGRTIIKNNDIDFIFSTGKPWTSHLVGIALSKLYKKPLVVEFQDPWTTNPFKPKFSPLKTRLDIFFEKLSVQKSSLVVATTVELQNEFRKRFPDEDPGKFIYLSNCYDPADIPDPKPKPSNNDKLILLHLGYLYVKRDPRNLLLGLKLAIENQLIDRKKINLIQVGTVDPEFELEKFIVDNGLDDIVILHGQVPMNEGLNLLWKADSLILLQPGTTTQTPSKLFEYILTGKPILTVSPKGSSVETFAEENNLGPFADSENIEEISLALQKLYSAWLNNESSMKISEDVVQKYSAVPLVAEFSKNISMIVN